MSHGSQGAPQLRNQTTVTMTLTYLEQEVRAFAVRTSEHCPPKVSTATVHCLTHRADLLSPALSCCRSSPLPSHGRTGQLKGDSVHLGGAGLRKPHVRSQFLLLMPSPPSGGPEHSSPLGDSAVCENCDPCLHRSMSLTHTPEERFISAL